MRKRTLVPALVLAVSLSAAAEVVPPNPEQQICIDTAPPVVVVDIAKLASRLAAFEVPSGLSVQQYQRLRNTARAFVGGRTDLAMRHWSAAVTNAYQARGGLDDEDIEALELIVLTELVKSEFDELREVMADVTKHNADKAALYDYLNEMEDFRADLVEKCSSDAICDVALMSRVETRISEARNELQDLNDASAIKLVWLQSRLQENNNLVTLVSHVDKIAKETAKRAIANMKS
jgi:hypothetical protein